jgi:cyclopropane-fatty-acyl-phospholipid synthase
MNPTALPMAAENPRRTWSERLWRWGIERVERDQVPDVLLRRAIRRLCAERLASETAGGPAAIEARKRALLATLRTSAVAVHPEAANAQHYELPAELFVRVLGRWRKYSSGYWPPGVTTLDAAEEAMLALTAERAELADGQEVLDLGCGWGSFTLWAASRYPRSRFLALSNSNRQRQFLEAEAAARGLANVSVLTVDANQLATAPAAPLGRTFDRVVSVEMLEHVRNHAALFSRLAAWLAADGRFFVHVFCHREVAYPFEVAADREDPTDWMARHFFTGGLMPSADLLPRVVAENPETGLRLDGQWLVDGSHYQRTAEAWLVNLDRARVELAPLFAAVYGGGEETRWHVRWRMFFLACAELFGFADGKEWMVAHYRFAPLERSGR